MLERLPLKLSSSCMVESSGLLLMVARDALVFLRSVVDRGGDSGCFVFELFRESHENGLVSFRVGAGGGAGNELCFSFSGGGGGGGNLTGDILPERPCSPPVESRAGRVGGRSGLFAASGKVLIQKCSQKADLESRSYMLLQRAGEEGMSRDSMQGKLVRHSEPL